MRLTLEERPYSGKNYRPRPEILLDEQLRLLIVATPWGPRGSARKVIERMTEYLRLAREDSEATSPFERLSCLSDQGNNLRIAALLANEVLYREDNAQEYRAGVELVAAMVDDNEMVWLQSGNPQILLGREGRPPLPMGSQMDLSFDMSTADELLAPLPAQLLGLDPSLNLNFNSFRLRDGDQLVMLSHSHLPEALFRTVEKSAPHEPHTLENLSHQLATSAPDSAFWLGILNVHFDRDEDAASNRSTEASS